MLYRDNASMLEKYVKAFLCVDETGSGCICIGMENADKRYFLKIAGANTIEAEVTPEESVKILKDAVSVYPDLEHPGLGKYINIGEYGEIVSKLAGLYDKLPVQLIHRDVHFGNFLFEDGKFSGYIDFDLSQRNIRVFDICYFLAALLSEEEKLKITEEQWFGFVENAFKEYGSITGLSSAERKAVPYVMECIELLFVSYFESVNNLSCADNAYKIYEFVKKHKKRIWESIYIKILLAENTSYRLVFFRLFLIFLFFGEFCNNYRIKVVFCKNSVIIYLELKL